ncbi:MAG: sugar ABC transporter substrate-binding protein [Armatimonadetes bacterium]|nr:sugar ABC transporter substrate-binding protein [Armatimonadota bacterium]
MRMTLTLFVLAGIGLAVLGGCPKAPPTTETPVAVQPPPPLEAPAPQAAAGEMPDFGELKPSKPYKVALIMKTMSNPFFQAMERGAKEEAGKLGLELSSQAAEKETDDEKQAGIVENAIAQKVDAIVIAPADSKTLIPALLKANAAGIPVINVDNRIDAQAAQEAGLKLVTFIGPDNAAGAEKAARHLFEAMGGTGKAAMLEGIRGVDNAENRKRGFERALADFSGIELADSQSASWELEQGDTVFTNMLTAHPDITGLFCANDMMALGAIRAIEAAGQPGKILVAGYDNLEAAQEKLKSGALLCTIEQHPDLMGAYGVRCAVALLEGQEIPREIAVPTDLVTKADAR